MSFKDRKRDDHGHVIGNDEVDGQECQHVSGGGKKPTEQDVENDKYNREMKAAQEQNAAMSENFDDDYEEEFEDYGDKAGHILNDAEEYIGEENANKIEYLINQEEYKTGMFENAITKNLEKGMSYEDALMKSIEDVQDKLFGGDIDKDLIDAINNADDDVLDEQFGKDTPERKLVGAIKDNEPQNALNDLPIPTDEDRRQIKEEQKPDEKEMKDLERTSKLGKLKQRLEANMRTISSERLNSLTDDEIDRLNKNLNIINEIRSNKEMLKNKAVKELFERVIQETNDMIKDK